MICDPIELFNYFLFLSDPTDPTPPRHLIRPADINSYPSSLLQATIVTNSLLVGWLMALLLMDLYLSLVELLNLVLTSLWAIHKPSLHQQFTQHVSPTVLDHDITNVSSKGSQLKRKFYFLLNQQYVFCSSLFVQNISFFCCFRFSKKLLWLRIGCTNNDPLYTAWHFVQYLEQIKGIYIVVVTIDC